MTKRDVRNLRRAIALEQYVETARWSDSTYLPWLDLAIEQGARLERPAHVARGISVVLFAERAA